MFESKLFLHWLARCSLSTRNFLSSCAHTKKYWADRRSGRQAGRAVDAAFLDGFTVQDPAQLFRALLFNFVEEAVLRSGIPWHAGRQDIARLEASDCWLGRDQDPFRVARRLMKAGPFAARTW